MSIPSDSPAGIDPRNRSDFQPSQYPRVNGQEAPPADVSDRNERIKLEFLAAYYAINGAQAELMRVRNTEETPARREEERKCLQAIERLLILRDGLEDQYAPLGVIAEPVIKEGYTVNVLLSFGNVDAAGYLRSEAFTLTASVPIPFPKGTRLEELDWKIRGPGIPRKE